MWHHSLHRSAGPDRHKALPGSLLTRLSALAETKMFPSGISVAKTFGLVVCCLVCCLAFSEFPETSNLSDDSSNDFIVVNELCTTKNSESRDSVASVQEAMPPEPQLRVLVDSDPFLQNSLLPASDLLPLISLRRI